VLGNLAAEVKVTEYISYTCPHCAHFEVQSDAPLRLGYIANGHVSIEVRHLVRDPFDMTVAMMTNCGEPSRFFRNHTAFLRSQDSWVQRADSATEGQKQRWSNPNRVAAMQAIASDLGFYDIMSQRGYDRMTLDRCLADQAMYNRILAMRQGALDAGVTGTPSFAINGILLPDAHDWPSLEAALHDRLK
jgi:protein-disulfide isomerase